MKIKKILALLTSTAMLLGSLNVSAIAAGSGDVNSDGSVTKEDAYLTMQYVLNPASVTGFDVNAADVTDCHGVSAKDVAMILQMVAKGATVKSVYVTAGKVDGAKVFQPVSWDGITEDAARLNAQDEVESMSISKFFDKYFGDVENTNRVSQINDFLEKVYLNDLKLTSADCQDWLVNTVLAGTDSSLSAFINSFYTDYNNDGQIDIEEAKDLFTEFNAVKLSEADIATISSNLTWFRTTFQFTVYDADTYTDSKTAIKSYEQRYDTNYGISTVDWYFFNNSAVIDKLDNLQTNGFVIDDTVYNMYSHPTTEQPFKENVIDTLTNVIYPYLQVANADGTVKAALDAIGGDRIELTINKGTLPSVANNADNISSYDEFVTEFGSFDDPTNTYYVDFSQVGYNFSSGSGSSDVTTEATTEAPTETTTEATTTTEAETTTEEATTTTEAPTETTTVEASTEAATEAATEDPYASLPTLASGTSIAYSSFLEDLIGTSDSAVSTSATDYAISGDFKDTVGKTYIRLKSGIGIIVKVGDNAVITVNTKSANSSDAARELQIYSGTDATGTSVLSQATTTGSDYEDISTGTLSAGFYFITASNGINVKSITIG